MKLLSLPQLIQELPFLLARIKTQNNFGSLKNQICRFVNIICMFHMKTNNKAILQHACKH